MKKRIILLITALSIAFLAASCSNSNTKKQISDKQLHTAINSYIDTHPGLLKEMVVAARKQVQNEKTGKKNPVAKNDDPALDKRILAYLTSKPELFNKMIEQARQLEIAAKQKQASKGKVKAKANKKDSKQQPQVAETKLSKYIHNYLVTQPRTVIESMVKAAQAKFMTKQKGIARQALKAMVIDKSTPVEGNRKGDTTIIEYFDYQCSACKEEWPQLKAALKNNKDLKVIFAEYPFFPGSEYAAKVSIAGYALDQKKFVKLHSGLMEVTTAEGQLKPAKIMQIATAAGYTKAQLDKYMTQNASVIKAELAKNSSWFEKMKFQGTPAIIIASSTNKNIVIIPGAPRNLQSVIDSVKNKAQA
jgi:protein-disulfide isomerase